MCYDRALQEPLKSRTVLFKTIFKVAFVLNSHFRFLFPDSPSPTPGVAANQNPPWGGETSCYVKQVLLSMGTVTWLTGSPGCEVLVCVFVCLFVLFQFQLSYGAFYEYSSKICKICPSGTQFIFPRCHLRNQDHCSGSHHLGLSPRPISKVHPIKTDIDIWFRIKKVSWTVLSQFGILFSCITTVHINVINNNNLRFKKRRHYLVYKWPI